MKLLRCKLCHGEVEIIGNERAIQKKIKCSKCGFTNDEQKSVTEVIVIRKRNKHINGDPER
jgi:hypothetical protein